MDDDFPSAIYHRCPECGQEGMMDVISHREVKRGLSLKLKCRQCGTVFTETFQEEKSIPVAVIISRDEVSQKVHMDLPEGDEVHVGDVLELDGDRLKVRAIETKEGRRVKKAIVSDIATIWTIYFNEIRVPISINIGPRTVSKRIYVVPEEEFTVGEDLYVDDMHIVIHAIKTRERMLRMGQSAVAEDIVRVYAKRIKDR